MARNLLIASAVALAAAVTPIAARPGPAPVKDVVQGERDYRAFGCAACHGTTGAGGGWQGPRLAPDPLPIEAFLAQLREPAAKMPRYSPVVLTDRQAAAMHAYLVSIRPGKRAADIPMLNR